MARRRTPEEQLADLEKKKKSIESEMRKARGKLQREQRKLDTRRKIILGAAVMAKAQQHADLDAWVQLIIEELPARDRELFKSPTAQNRETAPSEKPGSTTPTPDAESTESSQPLGASQAENQPGVPKG